MDKDVKELYQKKVFPHGKKAFMQPEDGIKKVRYNLFAFTVCIYLLLLTILPNSYKLKAF